MHASAMRQVGESIEGQLMNQIEWDWQQLDCSVLMEQLLDFKMEEICTLVALCCQESVMVNLEIQKKKTVSLMCGIPCEFALVNW